MNFVFRGAFLFFFLTMPSIVSAYSFAPLVGFRSSTTTFSVSDFKTNHFWNENSNRIKTYNTYERYDFILQTELGITHKDDIFIHAYAADIDDRVNGHESGLASCSVGWKRALRETENSIFSAQVLMIIPFGGYEPEFRYGKVGAEASALFAKSYFMKGFKTTLNCKLGYLWYDGFPSDQIRSAVSAWLDLSCRWQLFASLNLDWGLYNGHEPLDRSFIVCTANYRLLWGTVELSYYVSNKISLSAGYSHHIWGQNTGCGRRFYGSLNFCF